MERISMPAGVIDDPEEDPVVAKALYNARMHALARVAYKEIRKWYDGLSDEEKKRIENGGEL